VSLPWYPRFPREFLASNFVARLSYAEKGIYTELMDRAWLDPHCSIPADREELAKILTGPDATPEAVERVLEKWVPSPDVEGRLINKTFYGHWRRSEDRAAKARRAVQKRWERYRADPSKQAPRKRDPKLPTAEEFEKVNEMVEIWNANALPGPPRAQFAQQARAQATAMTKRIRGNPWLYSEFEHIVGAAMQKYGSMISKGEARFLQFSWFATGRLSAIEALRDYKLPLASKGAPARL
jgi:uncharacterized protein YdaU (DUF1376 family)